MSKKKPDKIESQSLKELWQNDLKPNLTIRNAFMTALLVGMIHQCTQDNSDDPFYSKILNATDNAKQEQQNFIRQKVNDAYDWVINFTN